MTDVVSRLKQLAKTLPTFSTTASTGNYSMMPSEKIACNDLDNALPAIIALVDAAQRTVNTDETGMQFTPDNAATAYAVRIDLAPALANLAVALGEPG